MAIVKRFEDLEVWQKARILSNEVYSITNTGDLKEDFGLKDQIRNSSGLVMDNIADGFKEEVKRNFYNFYLSPKPLQERLGHNYIVSRIKTILKMRNLMNYMIFQIK